MPKFRLSKLIRDRVIDRQVASGAKLSYRKLTVEEHRQALVDKIVEDSREVAQAAPEEIATELADVQQALDDLRTLYGLTAEDIATARGWCIVVNILTDFRKLNKKRPFGLTRKVFLC